MPRRLRFAIYLQLHTGFAMGLLRGVAGFARKHPELDLLKFAKPARYQFAELKKLKLDGVIAKISSLGEERLLARLGIPIVNVSGQIATSSLPMVNTDDRRVGEIAFGHFARRGYRHFAYCGPRTHRASQLRREGFAAEAQRQNLPCFHCALRREDETSPHPAQLRQVISRWLKTLPERIGVLCFTDRVAIAMAEAADLVGRRIPHDLAILGVGNDLTRLDFAHTEISSIELPSPQIGYAAMELLLQQVEKPRLRSPAEKLFQPVKIVTRRSTDHFAVADEAVAVALDYIRENRSNMLYVDDIARAAALSRRALEKRFSGLLGETINQVVQRMHFEHALELMAARELTLDEIAYASGFSSLAVFSRQFKARYGVPPSRYPAHA